MRRLFDDLGGRVALALALSIVVHAGAFAWLAHHPLAIETPPARPELAQVRLDFLPPPPVPAPPVPVEPEPPEPPPPPPPPEPPPPPPKPEPKPAPKPAPKPPPKPAPKPVVEPPPAVASPSPAPVQEPAPTETRPPPAPVPPPDLAALYRKQLIERIQANKFYPPLARRRNIEGEVKLRLRLDCQGAILDLQGEGGHLLLKNAALEAVEKSLPLAPPPGMDCPREFSFGIQFALE
jgi:periplasmic protein TonB